MPNPVLVKSRGLGQVSTWWWFVHHHADIYIYLAVMFRVESAE
jgi:hypothetical protein